MYHTQHGPRGAEEEREDFWTDIPEGSDMLPGFLPAAPGAMPEYPAGLSARELRTPAEAHNQAQSKAAPKHEPPQASHNDPLGSWTGVPETGADEIPTQDADDL